MFLKGLIVPPAIWNQLSVPGPADDIATGFGTNQIGGLLRHGAHGGGLSADYRNDPVNAVENGMVETVEGSADLGGAQRGRRELEKVFKGLEDDEIRGLLEGLTDNQRVVICHRYRLFGYNNLSYAKIGEKLGLKKQRVAKILEAAEGKVIKKL